MAETHVISGLKTKRAEIAGLLAECDERRAALKGALATIDAALRLFAYEGDPAEIKAKRKRRWMFKRGELQRAVMDALRAADGPLTNAEISEMVIRSKGWSAADAALAVADVYRFSAALNRDKKVPVWVSFPITFQVR